MRKWMWRVVVPHRRRSRLRTSWPVVLALVLAPCLMTAASAMSIPGKMLVNGWNATTNVEFFLEGATDTQIPAPPQFFNGDLSPDATQVAYPDRESDVLGHIWKSDVDGSAAMNLTAAAGLTGVNCYPRWSPDGRQIVFQHAEPVAGQEPCDAGFHVWLMNADGTGAHAVTASGFSPAAYPSFTPDGSGLICESADGTLLMNVDGSGAHVVPNVGATPAVSPDGSHIVSSTTDYSAADGGTYRRLLLTNLDGSEPQVLVERFISDADVAAYFTHQGITQTTDNSAGLIGDIGPVEPEWAPTGDLIAFSTANPFDPQGIDYELQRELWMYGFAAGQATRITTDDRAESGFSWRGDNTYPDHPSVTVDNVTVTFSSVEAPGRTTILRQEPGAAVRPDQVPVGPFFNIVTTAQVSGPLTVTIGYDPSQVPAAAVGHLFLARFDPEARTYFGLTSAVDPVHPTVTAHPVALGTMGLMWPLPQSHFSDVSSSVTDPYWALWEIEAAYAAGIVSGYSGGVYAPAAPVTRDQMAVYVARAVAGGDANVPPGPSTATFSDVPTDYWAFKYVEYAKNLGIVSGYSATTYAPGAPVDRGQMSVFIARAIASPTGDGGLSGYTPPSTPDFPDVPTDFWAYKYVEYIKGKGITGGYPDGLYHPETVVTRDQMAVYVTRAFELQ